MEPNHRRIYTFNQDNLWHGSNKNKNSEKDGLEKIGTKVRGTDKEM